RPLLQGLAAQALRMQLIHRLAELAELGAAEVERYLGPATAVGRDAGTPHRRGEPEGGGRAAPDAGSDAIAAPSAGREWRDAPRGDGGRSGRRGWGERNRFVPRVPVGKPDLEARVRLLTALHPALAAGE